VNNGPEARWLREVYQPNARQLTLRAVLVGMALGALMSLSNLYVVLKTGWSFGVTITACILAYALFRGLLAARVVRREFSILENNAMASVASAAGYMTGGGNMAALPALLILTGARPDTFSLIAWFALIAALGVFAAIPLKRQLVNIEQLPFPTGTATAETLRSLHDQGGTTGKARLLGVGALAGGVIAFFRDAHARWMPVNLPSKFGLPFAIHGEPAVRWTLALDGSLLLVGAGALMSFRTGWSLLLGAVVTYGWLAPAMHAAGAIAAVTYKEIVRWTVWGGAAVLVSSALISFALDWRSVARSFRSLGALLGRRAVSADPMDAVESPGWWFPAAFLLLGPCIVVLMNRLFHIPLWVGFLTLPLAFALGVVASRVTGETDVTPTKALGPVTQLLYGALLPGQVAPNLMGANVTGGVGLHAADLLTDLKSGFLVGARPRQQVLAQLFGVVAGAAMVVPAFNLLVPTADVLGSEKFPAPAALVWAGVSKLLTSGIAALHPTARVALLAGLVLGCALALLDRFAPRRIKPFVPSAAGLGIAMVIPGSNSIAMFLGAAAAEALRRRRPAFAERTVIATASGLIAGESLVGVLLAVLTALGALR
jgi:uncharacterized oligopeptide transporter (OPT) family protein